MTGWVAGVHRGTFGESLREQVRAVLAEALRHSLRVHCIAVNLGLSRSARQVRLQNSTACLRTMSQVHQPLLVPHAVQSFRSTLSHAGREIRTTERAESVLGLGADIRVAGVHWSFQRAQ